MGEMVTMIAQLGGFVKSKRYPYPGFQVLWRGLMRLYDLATLFQIQYKGTKIN